MESHGRDRPVVLVADDNRDIRELMALVLTDAGYEVVTARDGREAVEAAVSHYPDVAVLDVNMPEVDGFRLAERLREHGALARMGIIMVSARSSDADVVEGLQAGADDYVKKPVRVSELAARVRVVLERR
jgi:two-component system OmpR family response regulator